MCIGPRPSSVWIPAEQQVGHGFAGLAARQRRRPVRARGARRRARSRRSSSSTSTPRSAAATIDSVWKADALQGGPAGAGERLQERWGQQHEQPRQGRDHRPARARPGRVPRRLPLVGDPRTARARARHVRQPGDLVRRGAADGRPELRGRGHGRDGPVARGCRGRPRQRLAGAEDHPRPAERREGPLHAGRRARDGRRSRASARSATCRTCRPGTARRARSPARGSRPTTTSAR